MQLCAYNDKPCTAPPCFAITTQTCSPLQTPLSWPLSRPSAPLAWPSRASGTGLAELDGSVLLAEARAAAMATAPEHSSVGAVTAVMMTSAAVAPAPAPALAAEPATALLAVPAPAAAPAAALAMQPQQQECVAAKAAASRSPIQQFARDMKNPVVAGFTALLAGALTLLLSVVGLFK